MKKIWLVLTICIFMAGCGSDGDDGRAYLAFDWVYTPLSYSDDNYSLPAVVTQGTYYQSAPGTYDFSYTAWDGSSWIGSYTIYVYEGGDGGLFSDGADGLDGYFELWLLSIGPEFYDYGSYPLKPETTETQADNVCYQNCIKEKRNGNFAMRIEYHRMN